MSAGSPVHRCLSGEIGDGLPLGTYTGSSTTAHTYDLTMLQNDQFCGQGNMYIEGTVKGRVTMASENSIIVTGDLVLADGINGTDLVGLVAGNSLNVFHPWVDNWYKNSSNVWGWKNTPVEVAAWPRRYTDPGTGSYNPADGIQIAGSIQTLQHSFFVQQYNKGTAAGHAPRPGLDRPALARHRRHLGRHRLPEELQVRRPPQVLLASVLPAVDEREVGTATHR